MTVIDFNTREAIPSDNPDMTPEQADAKAREVFELALKEKRGVTLIIDQGKNTQLLVRGMTPVNLVDGIDAIMKVQGVKQCMERRAMIMMLGKTLFGGKN